MSVGVFVPKSESCIKYKYITMHLPSGSGYEASTPHIATVKVTRRWHLHCDVCVEGEEERSKSWVFATMSPENRLHRSHGVCRVGVWSITGSELHLNLVREDCVASLF
jgi:hypothetical protein